MQRNAVIFDLNGAMIFDTPLEWKAWNQVLEESGRPPVDEATFRDKWNGRSGRDMIAALWGGGLSEQRIHYYRSEKQRIYRELCQRNLERFCLVPGLERYLDVLKGLEVPCAVVTSSSRYSANFYYQTLRLERWFDRERIISRENVKHGKPAPDLFFAAAKQLHIAPEDCLVFEDSNVGVHAANYAGVGTVIVIDPECTFCPELSLKFDAVYPDFRAVFAENTVKAPV